MRLKRVEVVVIGLTLVVAAGFSLLVIVPGERRLRAARAQALADQNVVQAEQREANGLAALYREVTARSAGATAFHAAIPPEHGFAETFRTLSELLESAGLTRRSIQPGRVAPYSPRSGKVAAVSGTLMVQPVVIDAEGPMERVQALLVALEHWPRLNTVERLSLRAAGEAGEVRGEPRLTCQIVLNTYFLVPSGGRSRSTVVEAAFPAGDSPRAFVAPRVDTAPRGK